MKHIKNIPLPFIIGVTLSLLGCNQMSEQIADSSAGLNGGFEVSSNGLPVNWMMYTSNTVPNAEFDIVLDNKEFKEGKQSLRFDVKRCENLGGWKSPGFTNEFYEVGKFQGEGRYKLSFWIKNYESNFRISAGGVESKGGEMKTLIEGDENIEEWKLLGFEIEVPDKRWLRMELNITQPGTFWIDDINIDKL